MLDPVLISSIAEWSFQQGWMYDMRTYFSSIHILAELDPLHKLYIEIQAYMLIHDCSIMSIVFLYSSLSAKIWLQWAKIRI